MTTSAVSHRFLTPHPPLVASTPREARIRLHPSFSPPLLTYNNLPFRPVKCSFRVASCISSSSSSSSPPSTRSNSSIRLFVSGLSFRTTEEGLRNAFKIFGELVEVNMVMDKMANRPRGFAFLRYSTDEESKKAIEEMHGKFLDGRVIFVEIAKSRTEARRQGLKPS